MLTSGIYKQMKRAATHLFKKPIENSAFFKNMNFCFDLRPPEAYPRARQRSENPTPWATRVRVSPGIAGGGGGGGGGAMVRLGIDCT